VGRFLSIFLAFASISSAWVKTYEIGRGYCVQQTIDGNYILCASGWEDENEGGLRLIKIDTAGEIIWKKDYFSVEGGTGKCVRQTADGGYVIVGSIGAVESDLWLLKTDANGDSLWAKTYGWWWQDQGRWVEQTKDGGYIITGTCDPGGWEFGDLWILKTDDKGDTLWTQIYNWDSYAYELGNFIEECSDDNYIIGANFGLMKVGNTGDSLWVYNHGGGGGRSACQTSDGGYVFTATTWGPAGRRDIFQYKVGTDGDSLWAHSWGGADEDESYCVQQTTDGGYIISGETRSFGEAEVNIWLIKTDSNGDTLWTRILDAGWGYSVQQTTDGGYIVSGGSKLIKTDSLGYAGVAEPTVTHPVIQPDWQVVSAIGPFVTLRYENRPLGFHAQVFDASGRKVDEITSTSPSGTITWGEGRESGVYFLRGVDISNEVYKIIITR